MIPYYGHHGYKQFIKGKPIRYGYKVWSLASSGGYLYHMEPYAGVHTLLTETGLGHGPSVVLGLAEQAGYGCTGTMRQNQLFDVPFKPMEEFQKLQRGFTEVLSEGEKLLVRWRDNSVVTIASNVENVYTELPVRRWNKERKAYDYLQQPQIIHSYNQRMGGVDLHDLQVSHYHSTIRSKKWWWPIYAWTLHNVMNGDYDLLGFQRVVAQSLLKKFGTAPKGHGRPSSMSAAVTDIPRFDGVAHWPINTGRFLRCRVCDGCTSFGCEKCARPMHIECFKTFHNV
ncbi:putative piggyBac transposable element-derived protein 3-like [Triplophysa rosa]|uniref:PiggyBac transposable element-derived protein 3-like n=1 Tax=Triplophysa rosa TaxID=992332 RepID=A0A9W7WYB8_TRIRA|nr:putative piggyBac transposable element-derived protein 3-like [Triplophysa rosa]